MNNFTKRGADIYVLLMCFAAGAWVFSLRSLLLTNNGMFEDAVPYYEHVKFYLDNITRGIYPLWDPFRDFGTVNEFYLRRIGEFNPLFWLIAVLNKLGVSFLLAYKIFFAGYFFAGLTAFYLLGRRLFPDPRAAFVSALLLMFSSLGWQIFSSYLLFIFVPSVVFLYFLTAFVQSIRSCPATGDWRPARAYLLGLTFCLMILMSTYIPFYFLTAATTAGLAFTAVYARLLKGIAAGCLRFVGQNKVFTVLCAFFLLCGLLPAMLWYHESAHSETMVSHRSVAFKVANMPTIGIEQANEGGIIAPLAMDQVFFDLDQRRPWDFFIPLFAFLVIAAGAFTAANQRLLFLALWGFLVYLVGVADAAAVHQFLYDHIFFFKLFRNLQFFMWLVLLPVVVLFAGEVFSQLLDFLGRSRRRAVYAVYIGLVHAAAMVFLLRQEIGCISANYITVLLSALFFWALLLRWNAVLPLVLFFAVIAQPLQVNTALNRAFPHVDVTSHYEGDYAAFKLPASRDPNALRHDPLRKTEVIPYFCTQWFYTAYKNINSEILGIYLATRLLAYDRVEVIDDKKPDFKRVEKTFAHFENTAFVPSQDPALDAALPKGFIPAPQAEIVTADDPNIELVRFEPNRLQFKTHFTRNKFLVNNQNYHDGWRAFCDDRPIKLYRANLSFQGFLVPAGEHVVDLRFEKPGKYLMAYALISIFMGVFIYLIWLLIRLKR